MNDARNKLRSMGGIMASSPELMQAATQRFQDGGLAMTTPPMGPMRPAMQYNDVIRPQMEPPVVGLGRVAPVRPAGLPESPVFRGGRGPVLGAADEEDIIAELMAQSGAFRGGRSPRQTAPGLPADTTPAPEEVTETIRRLEQAPRKTPANERRLQELKELRSQMEPDVESREENLPGTTVLEAPVDLGGLVPKRAQEDPAEAEKIAQDAMDVLLKTQQPAGGEGGEGEEAPAKALKDYYNDARSLISEVYGEEEDDGVNNRMMDLAMIGLAIAAGQSPNALTNIAQGLLVGTQGMAQRREAERERERGLRTLALETAIAQQGAATEAEAEAARMNVEQQNKLEVARIRAGGEDGEKSRAEYRYNEVFKQTFDALVNPDPMTGRQAISPQEAVTQAAAAAAAAAPDAPSAQGVSPAPQAPSGGGVAAQAAVRDRIAQLREQNIPDEKIRQGLIEKGYNPADYGL